MSNSSSTSDQQTMAGASATPQQRIKELANFGNQVTVDLNMPIKRYYRSGMEMVRIAAMYHKEGNLENAYILYVKFMTLFLEKILEHPEYKTYPAPAKRANQTRLREALPIAEQLRALLEERFEREHQQWLVEQRQAEEEQRRRQQQLRDVIAANAASTTKSSDGTVAVQLPSAPSPLFDDGHTDFLSHADLDQVVYPNDFPPAANRPHAPGGLLLPGSGPPVAAPRPTVDRRLKPAAMPTSTSNESLLQGNLRHVLVPSDTMQQFLALAARNTAANVETCGILAGRMAQNRLIITHIIVPRQKGTADSCTTMNEEDIFDVQDQQNLITLGWIHTHPTQTAFLSSVDLHTHCSYQIMMPEALAIVCAPKYKTTGFFCLTPNYGLDYIAGCRQTGFHPHPNEPPLFMEAEHVRLDNELHVQVVDLRK